MIIDGEWERDVESTLPQEEPDFDAIAMEEQGEHEDQVHGGKPCDCPSPEPLPEPPGGYSDDPPFLPVKTRGLDHWESTAPPR